MKNYNYKFRSELKGIAMDGRTAVWLAERVGMSYVHITKVLNGQSVVKFVTAYTICKMLDEKNEVSDFFDKVV